jgi:hypothetical protein
MGAVPVAVAAKLVFACVTVEWRRIVTPVAPMTFPGLLVHGNDGTFCFKIVFIFWCGWVVFLWAAVFFRLPSFAPLNIHTRPQHPG